VNKSRLLCNPKVRTLPRLQDRKKVVILATHSLYIKVQKDQDVKQVDKFLPPR